MQQHHEGATGTIDRPAETESTQRFGEPSAPAEPNAGVAPTAGPDFGSAIRDVMAGVVLIGIGFTFGGSVFLGNPSGLDWVFDGLGILWIGRGICRLVRG